MKNENSQLIEELCKRMKTTISYFFIEKENIDASKTVDILISCHMTSLLNTLSFINKTVTLPKTQSFIEAILLFMSEYGEWEVTNYEQKRTH